MAIFYCTQNRIQFYYDPIAICADDRERKKKKKKKT